MVDITHKQNTLRSATAEATVRVSAQETIDQLVNLQVPKGNVFEMAKAAGLLGIKKTPDLLPDCHPLPIEYAGIEYKIEGLEIRIFVSVKTIYKTGVEVEAMHGASVVALTIYDMLKPIDKGIEILNIRLLEKKGGKSGNKPNTKGITAHVVVCSDTISKGEKEDRAGKEVIARLMTLGIAESTYSVIPDEPSEIKKLVESNTHSLLIFNGGTGAGPRDNTPDAVIPLLETRLPGVEETMRRYGQDRTPFAMLSRSVAGIKNGNVILAIPGSTSGATEAIDSVFPGLFHLFHVLKGGRHD